MRKIGPEKKNPALFAKNLKAKDYIVNRFIEELEKEGFLARLFRSH